MTSFRCLALLLAVIAAGPRALAGAEGHPWQTPSPQSVPSSEPSPVPAPPAPLPSAAPAPLPPLPRTLEKEAEPVRETPVPTRRVKETTREYDEPAPTQRVTTTSITRDVQVQADVPAPTQTVAATQIALYQPGPIGAFLGRVGNRLTVFGQPYYRLAPAPPPVLQQTAFLVAAPAPQLRFATPPTTTVVTAPPPTAIYTAPTPVAVKKCWPWH